MVLGAINEAFVEGLHVDVVVVVAQGEGAGEGGVDGGGWEVAAEAQVVESQLGHG